MDNKLIFIVDGYGVPKNIKKDENYNFYLKTVFNRMFDIVITREAIKPLVIFSGGRTDMFPPYKRSEASEMKRFFIELANRPSVKKATRYWNYLLETKSLSTVENLIYSKDILKNKKINNYVIYIFCEFTRIKKNKIFATKLFSGKKINIIGVDFDVSLNRYDYELINEREKIDIKIGPEVLRDVKKLSRYRKVLKERIKYLRESDKKHPEAVKSWWQEKIKDLVDNFK